MEQTTVVLEQRTLPLLSPSLDWEVEVKEVYVGKEQVTNFKALVHSSTGDVLNIPKASYSPITNKYLVDIVTKISELTGNSIQGYQSLDEGKKVLGFLKTEGVTVGGFPTDSYMVIGNSHDYSTGFFIGTSLVVIRCMNSFSMISQRMKVSHTKSYEQRVDEIMSYFESHVNLQSLLVEKFDAFSQIQLTSEIKDQAIRYVLGIDIDEEISKRRQATIDDVSLSIERECNDFGQTLLGLFNGFTYYTTHIKKYKSQSFGSVFGTGAEMNQKALRFCEQYL